MEREDYRAVCAEGTTMSPDDGRTDDEARPRRPWLRNYPPGVEWNVTYAPRPLFSLLDDAAARNGSAVCTDFFGRRRTYADVARSVNRAAEGLRRLGVGKGVRVGLCLPNCPSFVVFYFAILKAGGVVVSFNPLYAVEEMAHQARDSGTTIMVTADLKTVFDKVEALIEQRVLDKAVVCPFASMLPLVKRALFGAFRSADVSRPRSGVRSKLVPEREVLANDGFAGVAIAPEDDLALLQYTGGTTGTPKGAMLTHANAHANVMQVTDWARNLSSGGERVLAVLPLFHVFGMTVVMNLGVAHAAEIVLLPRFDPDAVRRAVKRTRPTVVPGVPSLFGAFVNHPKLKGVNFSGAKFSISGGAPLPAEIKRAFERRAGCALVEGYGLSEASPVVTCGPLSGPSQENSIGLPVPGTTVSLRALGDPSREVALGERGELCVKGPQVMRGYWGKPEETAAQFVDGHLRTGDVAVMDEGGFLHIVDRIKDLIICSGFNVYPRRVEDAIYAHAAVEEVTVIGVRHPRKGEAPKAFVKLKAGAVCTEREMMDHLETKLAKIEMPVAVEFRSSLPRTLIGKLSKKELKEEEELAAAGAVP